MNILSKQLLYAPQSSPTTPPTPSEYEVYLINAGTTSSLGTITNPDTTFSTGEYDSTTTCNSYVLDSEFHSVGYITPGAVGRICTAASGPNATRTYPFLIIGGHPYTLDGSAEPKKLDTSMGSYTWDKVCGHSYDGNNGQTYHGYGSCSNGLYRMSSGAVIEQYKISDITNWSKITGCGYWNNNNYYGYGISEGKLYYLYASGATQIGTDTTWTDITGSTESSSAYGYGINNGKLYALDSETPTQIGSDTTWTKISGYSKTGSGWLNPARYALGINDGKLYTLNGTTATQIGSATNWVNCSGYCTSSIMALAYDDTALYSIKSSGATKLMDGNFVYCGGNYQTSGDTCAIAIKVKDS